jgi:hypothetical protein
MGHPWFRQSEESSQSPSLETLPRNLYPIILAFMSDLSYSPCEICESLSENSMRQWPRISCQDNRHARWMVRPSCYAAAVLHLKYDLQSYLSTKLYIIIQYALSTREAHSGAYYGALVAQPRWGKPNKSIHQDTGQTLGPYNPGLKMWLRLQPTGYPRVSIGWFNEAMAANLMLSQQNWWASCCIHVCSSSSCTHVWPIIFSMELWNIIIQLHTLNPSNRATMEHKVRKVHQILVWKNCQNIRTLQSGLHVWPRLQPMWDLCVSTK